MRGRKRSCINRGEFMKSIARRCLAGLMLLAALAAPLAFTGIAMAQNPVPLINQPLVPDATMPGRPGFTLTVNGNSFVSTSIVKWNGSARATTFVSQSQLKATILASDIATANTASLTVFNPTPGGGTSNVVFFPITLPVNLLFGESAFGAGSGTVSAATGDFNGDGKLDLVVANNTGNNVSVLLGNGDGTFRPHVDYPVGNTPGGVAVADLNGDGKLDLAVANNISNDVSILLGNGDGTFQAAVNYSAGTNPNSVAVGDFNRDGKLDLVVTNPGSNNVSVLLGNGDGTFQPAVNYASGGSALGEVAIGDFNGDGKLDLAIPNQYAGGPVSIFLGNGDGTFQAAVNYNVGSSPHGVAAGDFNGDGKLDLAVANNISNDVSVLLGNGDGTFQAAVNYSAGAGPNTVEVADFNEDGKLDLVVADAFSNTVSVLLGNGDGTFQPAISYTVGSQANMAVAGDFNGDGRLDLAIADTTAGTVDILLQNGTVALSPPSVNFGTQILGFHSLPRSVTVTNIGTSTLNISGIAITGTDPGDFTETNNCGASLPPGGHCAIVLTFTPAQLGPRTAALTITDDAPGSPQSVPLSGFGVISGPNATLSATSLTFAVQLVGTTSPAHSVTLTNYGTMLLNITSIMASGDFSQSNICGSTLAPLASCTISVTFTPTQRGTRSGTLSITDNAPGSPQTVALSGTGTVVKLNPSSLSFHCGGQQRCPPPPQTTTLTNTGPGTLTINSITITGQYFSQTNNCPEVLGASQFCTITVDFNPQSFGTFHGTVSVSDDGGGSPQQVALSGTKSTRGLNLGALRTLSNSHTAAVPSPSGSSNVGTRIVQMVDPRRDDPFAGNGSKRELLVRFWYPTPYNESCQPAAYTSPAVWNYFSQLAGLPAPEVRTNSCLDAPVSDGRHPVVVFTPGYTGTFTDYTYLFEDLASRGYVVAAVDHTYEATAVEFPDGRFVESVFGSHLAETTWRRDEQSLSLAVSVRQEDLKFVVDELARLNGEAGGPFAGRLDLEKVAVAGHSLGGLTALRSLKQDSRFKAAILLDALMPDGSARVTDTPVLVLAMGRTQWGDAECRLWSDLRGPRLAVNLNGAEHVTPTDAVWLAKGAIKTGSMGPEKTIEALRNYIAAFLDTNLRGKSFDPLLRGPSSDDPDAAVTTQKQSLCGEILDH
jgi:dienelactone hydrolase